MPVKARFGQDTGTPTGTYRFTGKPVSQATGLYYDYLRWYDPSTGRFISQDPLSGVRSSPQSLNRYVYVQNQPTVTVDPTGACGEGGEAADYGCTGGLGSGYGDYANQALQNCGEDPEQCTIINRLCPDDPFICGGGGGEGESIEPPTVCECEPGITGDSSGAQPVNPTAPTVTGLTATDTTTIGTSTTAATSTGQDSLFSDFNFRDEQALQEHLDSHQAEFTPAYSDKNAYLEGARSFMDNAASEGNLYIQGSGTRVYAVEPGTGEFVAFDPSTRTIFTYMIHTDGWDWPLSQMGVGGQGWEPYPVAP